METLYATPTTKYVEVLHISREPRPSVEMIREFLYGSTADVTVGYDGVLYLHDATPANNGDDLIVEYGDYLVKVFGDVELFSADEFAEHFEIV
jgi:hypothetical protein